MLYIVIESIYEKQGENQPLKHSWRIVTNEHGGYLLRADEVKALPSRNYHIRPADGPPLLPDLSAVPRVHLRHSSG